MRPLRRSHSDKQGNSVFDYLCKCGWKVEVTRYSATHWEFDQPDYNAAQPSYLQAQELTRRLIHGHEITQCPNSSKRN